MISKLALLCILALNMSVCFSFKLSNEIDFEELKNKPEEIKALFNKIIEKNDENKTTTRFMPVAPTTTESNKMKDSMADKEIKMPFWGDFPFGIKSISIIELITEEKKNETKTSETKPSDHQRQKRFAVNQLGQMGQLGGFGQMGQLGGFGQMGQLGGFGQMGQLSGQRSPVQTAPQFSTALQYQPKFQPSFSSRFNTVFSPQQQNPQQQFAQQPSFQPQQPSFLPRQQSFQPQQPTFQVPFQQQYAAPQPTFQAQQQTFQPQQQQYTAPQPTFQAPPQQEYQPPQQQEYQPPQQQEYQPQQQQYTAPQPIFQAPPQQQYQPPQQQQYQPPQQQEYQPQQQQEYQAPAPAPAPAPALTLPLAPALPVPFLPVSILLSNKKAPVNPEPVQQESLSYGVVNQHSSSSAYSPVSYRDPVLDLPNTCSVGHVQPIYEDHSITETYCRCPDGSYGYSCSEGFKNPCNGLGQYFPADHRIPNNYYVECSWNIPYLMKCAKGTVWNQNLLTCDWTADATHETYGSQQSYSDPVQQQQQSYSAPVQQQQQSYAAPVPVRQGAY